MFSNNKGRQKGMLAIVGSQEHKRECHDSSKNIGSSMENFSSKDNSNIMMSTAGSCLQQKGISNGRDNSNSSDVSNVGVAQEFSH
jgi:hypothetical protein